MSPRARIRYREELDQLEARALEGLEMVNETLTRTLEAYRQGDEELAQRVIADDDRIDGRYLEVHQSILALLATQAPVAVDLRLIAALLDVIKHVERMGDQCVNIAKLIPTVGGDGPEAGRGIAERIVRMGEQVHAQISQARHAFAGRDVEMARDLVLQDDLIDDLNRECFALALDLGGDFETREWAMASILVARALERTGDYTVDIGEQIAFVVTGLFQEFEDASHPLEPGGNG